MDLFENVHEMFIHEHMKSRNGEARRRLEEGHGHAEKLFLEKVWWVAFGNLLHLFPEYEVLDYKNGYRYLDFAYIRNEFRACFEIDGYGPHWRDVNRKQFAEQLTRQNHLIIDGWKVIRFAYDDIVERPRQCQQIIQQLMGRWLGESQNSNGHVLTSYEKEIIRLAARITKPLTPGEVSEQLGICRRTAQKLLHGLLDKQVLIKFTSGEPNARLSKAKVGNGDSKMRLSKDNGVVGARRIRAYKLNPNRGDIFV